MSLTLRVGFIKQTRQANALVSLQPSTRIEMQTLSQSVFYNFAFWEAIADSINPILGLWLVFASAILAREDWRRGAFFLGFSLASILLVVACCKVVQSWHLISQKTDFPSTHMTFAVGAAIWLAVWKRRTMWISLPILIFYAWLMTALRFHSWLDLFGGTVLALSVSSVVYVLSARHLKMDSSTRVVDAPPF